MQFTSIHVIHKVNGGVSPPKETREVPMLLD